MDAKEEIGYLLGLLDDPEQKVYELLKAKLFNNQLEVVGQFHNHWLNPKATLQQVLDSYLVFYQDHKRPIPLRNNLNKIFIFSDEQTYIRMTILGQQVFAGFVNEDSFKISLDSILKKCPENTNFEQCFFKLEIKVIKPGNMRQYQEQTDCMFDSEAYMYNCFYKRIVLQLPPNKYSLSIVRNIPESILQERSKLWLNPINWQNLDSISFNQFNLENLVEYFEFTCCFFEIRYNEILYKRIKRDSKNYLNTLKEYLKVLQSNQPLILKGRHTYTQKYSAWYMAYRKFSLKLAGFLNNVEN